MCVPVCVCVCVCVFSALLMFLVLKLIGGAADLCLCYKVFLCQTELLPFFTALNNFPTGEDMENIFVVQQENVVKFLNLASSL